MGHETHMSDEIRRGILDWLHRGEGSPRKLIARIPPDRKRPQMEERLALGVAKILLDRGLVSILTRRRGGATEYLLERAQYE